MIRAPRPQNNVASPIPGPSTNMIPSGRARLVRPPMIPEHIPGARAAPVATGRGRGRGRGRGIPVEQQRRAIVAQDVQTCGDAYQEGVGLGAQPSGDGYQLESAMQQQQPDRRNPIRNRTPSRFHTGPFVPLPPTDSEATDGEGRQPSPQKRKNPSARPPMPPKVPKTRTELPMPYKDCLSTSASAIGHPLAASTQKKDTPVGTAISTALNVLNEGPLYEARSPNTQELLPFHDTESVEEDVHPTETPEMNFSQGTAGSSLELTLVNRDSGPNQEFLSILGSLRDELLAQKGLVYKS